MSDDVKDAGLVAMISSILGGNKRADSSAPPPLTEVRRRPAGKFRVVAADLHPLTGSHGDRVGILARIVLCDARQRSSGNAKGPLLD